MHSFQTSSRLKAGLACRTCIAEEAYQEENSQAFCYEVSPGALRRTFALRSSCCCVQAEGAVAVLRYQRACHRSPALRDCIVGARGDELSHVKKVQGESARSHQLLMQLPPVGQRVCPSLLLSPKLCRELPVIALPMGPNQFCGTSGHVFTLGR